VQDSACQGLGNQLRAFFTAGEPATEQR